MSLRVLVVTACVLAPAAARSAPDADASLFRQLEVSFGTRGSPPPVEEPALAPLSRANRLRAFVRARMKQDAFYDTVLPLYFKILNPDTGYPPNPFVLSEAKSGGRTFYYIKEVDKPCAARDLVRVAPWWDLASPVWICNSSYRPDVVKSDLFRAFRACESPFARFSSSTGTPATPCRCGAFLTNCARDPEQAQQIVDGYHAEPLRTMQDVIQHHRPFSEALTRSDTVRSDFAELYYARVRFLRTGAFTLPKPDASHPLSARPRDPEFTGSGVLDTPAYLYYDDARRLMIGAMWEDFLCTPLSSTSVDAHAMFEPDVVKTRVRYHATMPLAAKVGCRDCHARLENLIRAYSGFTSVYYGMSYRPEERDPGTIGFYVRDSGDLRGEGPASLAWVAQMIVKQPEFARCMVHKSEEIAYGGTEVPTVVHDFLQRNFERDQDLASLLEDALVARHAGPVALTKGALR